MVRERPGHTLQTTALLNETLLRLLGGESLKEAADRDYFFGAAARAMRQVLVDHARKRAAVKRGGHQQRLPLDDLLDAAEEQDLDVIALDEALGRLSEWNQRQSQVVTLRFYAGLSMKEIAATLGVGLSTVENDWRIARAWLRGQLSRRADHDPGTMGTGEPCLPGGSENSG